MSSANTKSRLDKLLVAKAIASTRERAQALILAGRVLVNEQKVEKPGTQVAEDAAIRLLGEAMPYVSRGGLKLAHAMEHWKINLQGAVCLDVGASTGGFTDCMLQAGAAQVVAVDTGYGQIAAALRDHPRVRLMEKTNARYLEPAQLPETIAFIAMDVSFISATLVLPAVLRAAFEGKQAARRELVLLVKPQFEAGRGQVGKGGIVRDEKIRAAAVEKVRAAVEALGGQEMKIIDSPISGAEGNREFLLHATFDARYAVGP